jgi:1-aminocyclopropane-1-carboxylate deaminase/D-cysteine desulfhydrase-like pyridoxal-dependent ACC family enzyme
MNNGVVRTPIEQYSILGRTVFVKREDLFGVYPAPPLGKLRGLNVLLRKYHAQDVKIVGCWDTRVSKLGQGLAALVQKFGDMHAIVSYPARTGEAVPEAIRTAEALGAEIVPIRGNHVSICYAQVTKIVAKRRGTMLPFGLECPESVTAIASEAASLPPELSAGTIVLCCGSGVTLAGLLRGLRGLPRRVIGVSSGRSVTKIMACLSRYLDGIPKCVEINPASMPYNHCLDFRCPFPAHPNYDLKAWKFLVDNIDSLRDPVFFWNIGA